MSDLAILFILVGTLCYSIYVIWTRSEGVCGALLATVSLIILALFSVDIYLEFRDHSSVLDKEDRFQRALCGDTYHLAEFDRQASACRDSRKIGETAFLFRAHQRILSNMGNIYEHVIYRWATTQYLQVVIPMVIIVVFYMGSQFLTSRDRLKHEANTQKHQMEISLEASRQQSAVISQFTQTLTDIQNQRSLASRSYTGDAGTPKIEEVM